MKIIPPHSLELERALIGQILLEPSLLKKSALREGDFYTTGLRRVFVEIENIARRGETPDLLTLSEKLSPQELQAANECMTEAVSAVNFPFQARRLSDLTARRRLQKICFESAEKLNDAEISDVLMRIRDEMGRIISGQGSQTVDGKEIALQAWTHTENRAKHGTRLSGIPTGVQGIDSITDGYQAAELTIPAGRPSTGKTAFALSGILTAAQAGFPAGFISIEMGSTQIGLRLQACLSEIPMWKLRKGQGVDWERLATTSNTLSLLPLHFVFGIRNLRDVISSIVDLVESKGAKIVFVDYLQLIRADGAQNREREISMISGELKALAVSLKVPIVCLSQLSRAPEKREDRRPGLADLRDSGSIEQDADLVIFLYRWSITEPKGPVEFIIAKGRNCGCGTVKGYFDGDIQRFKPGEEE